MTDIALTQNALGDCDLSLNQGDLAPDSGLGTAVTLSLNLNARAEGLNGWWADVASPDARPVGSKLWTLARSKTTQDVLLAAKAYATEALAWLVEEGAAKSIQVNPKRINHALVLDIQITRPDGSLYSTLWQGANPTTNPAKTGGR